VASDRVTQDQLFVRVEVLYAKGRLDHDIPDIQGLADRYDAASKQVIATLGVKEHREWNCYGGGFASFLESWFYREEKHYEISYPGMVDKGYRGVSVVFSLLEPMFATCESTQTWDQSGGSSMLPSLGMIDTFESQHTQDLSDRISRIIRDEGIPKVSRRTLDAPISPAIQIESNMSFGELTLFDAFYQWMD